MATRRPSLSWLGRHRRTVAALAVAALLVLVGLVAFVSWGYSSRVVVPERHERTQDITVEAIGERTVTLSRDEESERPGVYGLVWQGGRAIVGPVLESDGETVTRRLRELSGYLAPGDEVAVEYKVWVGNPREALGIPFREVHFASELGPMSAWLVPGLSDAWAILVHGINDDPRVGLRLLPALREAGLPAMLIAYREDPGAPSADGKHHMGLTEWREVQGAARYALQRGARRLVLVGYSMGGALVTQFMQRSPLADRVSGLVLDGPALDWREILASGATEMGLPAFAAKPVEWMVGARIDADWESLDAARHPEDFPVPVLLFHGVDDEVVPIEVSEEFAAALPPGRVELHRVPKGGHTANWNNAPRRYEAQLLRFLARIGAEAPAPPPAAAEPASAGQRAR